MFDPDCYAESRKRQGGFLEKTYCQCAACIATALLFALASAAVTAFVLI